MVDPVARMSLSRAIADAYAVLRATGSARDGAVLQALIAEYRKMEEQAETWTVQIVAEGVTRVRAFGALAGAVRAFEAALADLHRSRRGGSVVLLRPDGARLAGFTVIPRVKGTGR